MFPSINAFLLWLGNPVNLDTLKDGQRARLDLLFIRAQVLSMEPTFRPNVMKTHFRRALAAILKGQAHKDMVLTDRALFV